MIKVFLAIVFASAIVLSPLDEKKPTRAAKVAKNDIYVFIDCEPSDNYEVLGEFKLKGIIMSYKSSYIKKIVVERCKKKFPELQGILIDTENDFETAKAIKFEN